MSTDAQNPAPIDVLEVVAIVIDQFASLAWQKFGLQPDAMTGTLVKDMSQAKICVDVVGDLSKHLLPSLDEEDRRRMENLVSDLRISYVQKAAQE